MPLRKHEPVPKEAMYRKQPDYTICEVLREIYHLSHNPDIRTKCRIAMAMAKRMQKALERRGDHSTAVGSGFWDENPNWTWEDWWRRWKKKFLFGNNKI